jgi:hypothetical protein
VTNALCILTSLLCGEFAGSVVEQGPRVALIESPEAAALARPAAVQHAIECNLGEPIVFSDPSEAGARMLTISVEPGPKLLLRYRDSFGAEIERSLAGERDEAARVEEIGLLAANLIRNEADEILSEFAPVAKASGADLPAEPSITASRDAREPLVVAASSRPSAGSAVAAGPWSLGALVYLSSRAGVVDAPSIGVFVSRALGAHLALGATDLDVAPAGGRTALTGGPFVEGSWAVGRRLEPFGELAVPLQVAWGHNRDATLGAEPFVGSGVRVRLSGRTSIAAGLRVAVVASKIYSVPPGDLVQGTISASGGLAIAVRF